MHFYDRCRNKNIPTRLLRHGSIFTRFARYRIVVWRFCCYVSWAEIYRFTRARKYQAVKVTRNFRSRSKVYRNVVKQLAPTRSMASFVLLQTVPERHVSAFSVECLGSKRWSRSRSRYRTRCHTHSVHTSNPSFNGARELFGQWTGRTSFINESAALFSIHFYTPNYEFQILYWSNIMIVY